jgi:hypothetical protein
MSDGRFPYEIVSRWRVAGAIDEVYAVLTDAAAMPGWWPEAYTRVSQVAPGDADGRGRVSDIVTRGFLPYDVNWRLTVVAVAPPTMIRVSASGDLTGEGEWRLDQDGAAHRLHRHRPQPKKAPSPVLRHSLRSMRWNGGQTDAISRQRCRMAISVCGI